ncbi:MAG: hypothetical protein ABIP89_14390 [Polyangiaceae bacterium]
MKTLLLVLSCFLFLACGHYTVLTPAQLAERGTHRYPNVSRENGTEACASALSTLGYKVTVMRPDTGLIKTAPATIMVSATGGAGYANTSEDGLAWGIVVETSGSDVVVHATPRGFRNGSELHDANMWTAEIMDAKFQDLWREVDGTLNTQGPAKGAHDSSAKPSTSL